MAGFDDNVAIMEDWVAPSPSPRTLFTAMLGEDKSSKPILERELSLNADTTEELFRGSQGQTGLGDSGKKDSSQEIFQLVYEEKSGSRGGLGERIAARAGFNAPKLNTENIRPAEFSFKPDVGSPCLTISSPGLSPATLLESPVFLSNPLVQPSPTTGKFPFLPSSNSNALSSCPVDKSKDDFFEDMDTSFAFPAVSKPSSSFFQGANNKLAALPHQSFPRIEVSVESDNSMKSQTIEAVKSDPQNKESGNLQADFSGSSAGKLNGRNTEPVDRRIFDSAGGITELSPPLDDSNDEEQRRSSGDFMAAAGGGAPAEDGYNWRKYGQKQVKGSECPRSYYKCTHPSCPVKKKVERSREGHITEIVYKGAHNHSKPPPNRRSALGSSNPVLDMQVEVPKQQSGMDGDSAWASAQQAGAAGTPDNAEVTSAGSTGLEHGNHLQVQSGTTQFESGDIVDVSSTFSNDEDEEDRGTHGSVSLGYDGEGDESESKRRKLEVYATEMSGATRAIREPRVVVQTTSDVDILDDGYRWRKYGQKVVKGNPNPRSYYKCTAPGCMVRKHVERASHDLKSVITTYEGKHNHDVPAARNSNHGNSGGSATQQAASGAQIHVHQQEPCSGIASRFERPTSASASFGPFGLGQQLGPSPPVFSFGMNQPGLANLTMPGLGFGQGKLPVLPMHPYLAQQPMMTDVGFVLPKGDPKVEPISEPGLGLSSNSSMYGQIMSRLSLGPQM